MDSINRAKNTTIISGLIFPVGLVEIANKQENAFSSMTGLLIYEDENKTTTCRIPVDTPCPFNLPGAANERTGNVTRTGFPGGTATRTPPK
jgi:hypothetical protein